MAQNDLLRRYFDAGIAFTQMTRQRAEAIVRDLVKAGEVQTDQAQQAVQDIVDRSRENTERLVEIVRQEIRNQMASIGVATADDIKRLEARIDAVGARATAPTPAPKGPTTAAATPTSAASTARPAKAPKKAPAKSTTAKKTAAKKTAAKRA